MPKNHIVKQGEHMSGIAAGEGFGNFHTIFDRPENADLKQNRDPHVLFPGDLVFVPDREDRNESRPTDAAHKFQTEIPPLFLRCKLLDVNGTPIAKANCNLTIDSAAVPDVTTNGSGILLQQIGRLAKTAEITAHLPPTKPIDPNDTPPDITVTFDAKIGSLNPETKFSGQQARLNNMAYFAGFTVKDLEQLLWATEEFECDQNKAQVIKRPKLVPAPKEGEDDPATSQPDAKTGIQDADIIAKLKKVHGL
jgi:hypothetical protein